MTGAFDPIAAGKVMLALASGDFSGIDEADIAALSPSNADRAYAAWKARQRAGLPHPMTVEVVELISHPDGRRRALIAIEPHHRIAAGETLVLSRPV